MLKSIFLTFAILSTSIPLHSHADVIITMAKDGKLQGLPEKYSPAILKVTFSNKAFGAPVESIVLTLGQKNITIPKSICAYLQTTDLNQITLSASWYHDLKLLPPYIKINFNDPGEIRRDSYNPGYSLLFNLDTCRLIEMEINVIRNGGNGCQFVPVDLSAICKPKDLQQVLDIKPHKP